MLRFLRENWLWIVVPILFVLLVLTLLVWTGGDDDIAPFIYTIK